MARGRLPMYQIEISHPGLCKYRHITGRDQGVVEQKARAQLAIWDEQWETKCDIESRREDREQRARAKDAKKAIAGERTVEAEHIIQELREILASTLKRDDFVDWETLKDKSSFTEFHPIRPNEPAKRKEPRKDDVEFQVRLGLLDKLFRSRREQILRKAQTLFEVTHTTWRNEADSADAEYQRALEQHKSDSIGWNRRKQEFLQAQLSQHHQVEDLKSRYLAAEEEAVEEYNDFVLSKSEYPNLFPREFELSFVRESGILIIDYQLPSPDDFPTLKQVKYIASRDEFENVRLRESDINGLYDSVIYQTCLRTIHEVYEADRPKLIKACVFNGWVKFTDRANGKEATSCIMSVQAERDAFLSINLTQVDPKVCFRALKGVGSSRLHSMAAVAPVARINREDSRFVDGVAVANGLSEGTNIAAIGWEEFEHLIRELFEKEFSSNGGECRVTRASRDGGVDAVAFDPDPIRGGKIVIQAKRYTNTVGVSAVRDLFGTVMNEGATKGILVTTSNFGPDAYSFAKDKPLTLLDGGNLLHLLMKHGHAAHIDLAAAKKVNPSN